MVLFPKYYTVKRSTGSSYVNGKAVINARSNITIIADCQPLSSEMLESLSVGQRERGGIAVFTDEILKIAGQGSLTVSDLIEFQGIDYEIISVSKHRSGVLENNKYTAVKVI